MSEPREVSLIDIFGGFLLGLIAMLLFAIAVATPNSVWRQEAIKHGAARFEIVDEATGETAFRWRDE